MSDSEELTKLVDTIYKNILDKFNPSARQLISAGKTYLKALHGASAASKMYVDAIIRLARNAQQATWGGAADIGTALMQMVDVYKEIHSQQLNLLKAFYVDLLVPLESNLEKDTKVVQGEQKRFMQQHKIRQEAYLKASGAVKKFRKKNRSSKSSATIDKELKQMQILEEERAKIDSFCEQSLRDAITQERRRYGFVLERQCSLTKHYIAYHSKGHKLYQNHLDNWQKTSKTREFLPEVIENMFPSRSGKFEDGLYAVPGADPDDRLGSSSLRKTKSMDSSCLDLRSLHHTTPAPAALTRAKSDFNLASSHQSLNADRNFSEGSFQHFSLESGPDWWCGMGEPSGRPHSMAMVREPPRNNLARALYSYLSSGDHQLSFHEGDVISLIGERNKGWQYGENLRNHRCGWFPIAYTEPVPLEEQEDCLSSSPAHHHRFHSISIDFSTVTGRVTAPNVSRIIRPSDGFNSPGHASGRRPCSMFVESSLSRASSISKGSEKSGSSSGHDEIRGRSPPPPPPPLPSTSSSPDLTPRRVCRSFTSPVPLLSASLQPKKSIGTTGSTSLHSSNDSGFSNESNPPQPPVVEVEFKEEDTPRDNMFASVKLRKTVTNDRSAPMLL